MGGGIRKPGAFGVGASGSSGGSGGEGGTRPAFGMGFKGNKNHTLLIQLIGLGFKGIAR